MQIYYLFMEFLQNNILYMDVNGVAGLDKFSQ